MKNVILGLLTISILAVGVGYVHSTFTPRIQSTLVESSADPTSAPDIKELVVSATPVTRQSKTKAVGTVGMLRIPTLHIEANIESVGLDQQKHMDVPKNAQHVAWYNLGVKPGDRGNAVMAGHYDTVTGAPAIFYKLGSLAKGDDIIVKDSQSTSFVYRVVDQKTYASDAFPLQEVFGVTDTYRLNLITCSGQFNNASNNYSHRTVVYSELVR